MSPISSGFAEVAPTSSGEKRPERPLLSSPLMPVVLPPKSPAEPDSEEPKSPQGFGGGGSRDGLLSCLKLLLSTSTCG